MLSVSREYTESMAGQLRGESLEVITLDIINLRAQEDAQYTVSKEDDLSNVSGLLTGKGVQTGTYATLEPYRFVLDGSQELPPDPPAPAKNRGFLSDTLSDGEGVWASPPWVEMCFTENFDFAGLEFTFDKPTGEYVSRMKLSFFTMEGAPIREETVEPDGASYAYEHGVSRVGRILIQFLSSSMPYRRCRVQQIRLGISREFAGARLAASSRTDESDPLSRRLPREEYQWTVWDWEQEFDPDNKRGYWTYVDQLQPITQKMGYQLPSGQVEWLPETNYVLTGDPVKQGYQIKFSAAKRLSLLTGIYRRGVVPKAPVSLYELAEGVMRDALGEDNSQWSIAGELRDMFTTAPLPALSHRECLQLIAQAGLCRLYTAHDGVIHLDYDWYPAFVWPAEVPAYSQLERPAVEIIPPLSAVEVLRYSYQPESQESILYEETLPLSGIRELWVDYGLAQDAKASVAGGALLKSELYGYGGAVTVQGEGEAKLTITGKKVSAGSSVSTLAVNPTVAGETDRVENPLVTTEEGQRKLARHRAKYLGLRNAYTLKYRGNPELECGDAIRFDTEFAQSSVGVVLSSTLDFNGALKGTLILKRVDSFGGWDYTTELFAGDIIGVV